MNLNEYIKKEYCIYHCNIKNEIVKRKNNFISGCQDCDDCNEFDCDYYNFVEDNYDEQDFICEICPLKKSIYKIEQHFEINYKF